MFFLGGLVALMGGLLLIHALGGFPDSGMPPWAWLAVGVLGIAFVHSQVAGMSTLVTLIGVPSSTGTGSDSEPSTDHENAR
jgi:hypothetical protein